MLFLLFSSKLSSKTLNLKLLLCYFYFWLKIKLLNTKLEAFSVLFFSDAMSYHLNERMRKNTVETNRSISNHFEIFHVFFWSSKKKWIEVVSSVL